MPLSRPPPLSLSHNALIQILSQPFNLSGHASMALIGEREKGGERGRLHRVPSYRSEKPDS